MPLVGHEALAQVKAGRHAIDVNVAAEDVDHEGMLPLVVKILAEAVDVPIYIDAAHPKALAAALAVWPGKPLVNSVTGEDASLKTVLPLVKSHRCAVIGLCMDEERMPGEATKRVEIGRQRKALRGKMSSSILCE